MFSSIAVSIEWQQWFIILLSLSLSGSIIALASQFPRFYGHSGARTSVQAVHSKATPRVGGIAVFGALLLTPAFVPAPLAGGYAAFIYATSILFIAGLLEDLGFEVSPAGRLIAALVAGAAVIVLLGVWLPRIGIPGSDGLMQYWVVGVPLTLLATAGVANGFNLIDGVNGLAGLTAMGAAVAFSYIAQSGNYHEMEVLCLMLAGATLGFFLLNFPFGLLFLGDGGAYTLGFVLAWFGIAILVDVPEASPWAILLCVFWPVADTLLAIYRRLRRKAATTVPDRLHVHQMVMRMLELCVLGRGRRHIANPLSTIVLAPFVLAPPLAAVFVWNDDKLAFTATCIFGLLFFSTYLAGPGIARRLRTRPPLTGPVSA